VHVTLLGKLPALILTADKSRFNRSKYHFIEKFAIILAHTDQSVKQLGQMHAIIIVRNINAIYVPVGMKTYTK